MSAEDPGSGAVPEPRGGGSTESGAPTSDVGGGGAGSGSGSGDGGGRGARGGPGRVSRRRRAREAALAAMFQIDVGNSSAEEALRWVEARSGLSGPTRAYAMGLVRGAVQRSRELDHLISAAAKDWTVSRMAATERNVLRIAAYELLFDREVPAAVVINEAVEIARRYGEDASARFVNGILSTLAADSGLLADTRERG